MARKEVTCPHCGAQGYVQIPDAPDTRAADAQIRELRGQLDAARRQLADHDTPESMLDRQDRRFAKFEQDLPAEPSMLDQLTEALWRAARR